MSIVICSVNQMYAQQIEVAEWHRYRSDEKKFWNENAVSAQEKEEIKRETPLQLTTAIVVPCYFKHARFLYSLLQSYEMQTRLPDEVVISLSEAHLVAPEIFEQLQNELWAFPVTLVLNKKRQLAGDNRNTACSHAQSDIFICQDADDIAHPQRVEIIHYFFTHYPIDLLLHEYRRISPEDSIAPFCKISDITQIQFCNKNLIEEFFGIVRYTNGNNALSRQVFEKVKWPKHRDGEDTWFNKQVYRKFNCILLHAVLHGYRQYLSSSIKGNKMAEVPVEVKPINAVKRNKIYQINIIGM